MIPKIIHYCWISGDEFPEQIKRFIGTWKQILPDYELRLWDLKRIVSEFKAGNDSLLLDKKSFKENIWLKQTIEKKKYAFAADYIRIYALNKYGGIYLDTDVEITGPFEQFLENDLFIGFDEQNDFETAILGSIPGHPWLEILLDYYCDRKFIKEDDKPDTTPLPAIFEKTAKQLFKYKKNGRFQMINNQVIAIYPSEYFSPKNIYFTKIRKTEKTVAIHHFDGGWLIRDLKYHLKNTFHQSLYLLGGKAFHNYMIQAIRKLSNSEQ